MTLWHFPPLNPVRQTLDFSTDVLRAKAGEERVANRDRPRSSWRFTHRMPPDDIGRAMSFLRQESAGDWTLPLWSQAVQTGPQAAGTTSLTVSDTTDFASGQSVLIWAPDAEPFETTISGTSASTLTLAAGLPFDVSRLVVSPTVAAFQSGLPGVTPTDLAHGQGDLSFEETAPRSGPSSTLDTYQSTPLLSAAPATQPGINGNVGQPLSYQDSGLGGIARERQRDGVDATREYTLRTVGRADTRKALSLLYAVRGAQSSFWMPTWADDLRVTAPAALGAVQLRISASEAPPNMAGRHLAFRSGPSLDYRQVTTVTDDGADLVLTLSSALSFAVDLGAPVSLLSRVRLEDPTVEIAHYLEGYADISLSVRELPNGEAERVTTGSKIVLYTFARGATTLRYTSAAEDISTGGNTYTAGVLTHSTVRASARSEKAAITLTVPLSEELGQTLSSVASSAQWTVTIQQADDSNLSDLRVVWLGFVGPARVKDTTREITLNSYLSKLGRKSRSPRLVRQCQWHLGEPGCGVNIAAFTTAATVTAGSRFTFTVPEAATIPEILTDASFLVNGALVWNGERRSIEATAGDQVSLLAVWPELEAEVAANSPVTVSLEAGCDFELTTCRARFGNELNFAGSPYLPEDEAFQGSIV